MFITNFHRSAPSHPCSFLRGPRLLGVDLELLDRVDLLSRVQTLWAGVSAVLDGVAAVELELVIDGIQALLGELVTAVLYPPGETVPVYSTEQSWYAKHLYTNASQFQSSNHFNVQTGPNGPVIERLHRRYNLERENK